MSVEAIISLVISIIFGGGILFKMFEMGKTIGAFSSELKNLNKKIDRVEDSLNRKIGRVEDSLNRKIDRVEDSLNKKMDNLEKKIDLKFSGLPCEVHSEKISEVDKSVAYVKGQTEFILSAKQSPRALNQYGLELFRDIDGNKFLEQNKHRLFAFIDAESPKTAYDVEEDAKRAVFSLRDDDSFNEIKVWLYNSPAKKIKIGGKETDYCFALEDACFVISLPLRDMYLEEHPEILK